MLGRRDRGFTALLTALFVIRNSTGDRGDAGIDTVYFRKNGKWHVLPPIHDWYPGPGGELLRRPGYATNITGVVVDPVTGMIWVRLNPPEGEVLYPVLDDAIDDSGPPLPKTYYVEVLPDPGSSDPPRTAVRNEGGSFSRTPVVATGADRRYRYINFDLVGKK